MGFKKGKTEKHKTHHVIVRRDNFQPKVNNCEKQ